jgi:hypothetical protein
MNQTRAVAPPTSYASEMRRRIQGNQDNTHTKEIKTIRNKGINTLYDHITLKNHYLLNSRRKCVVARGVLSNTIRAYITDKKHKETSRKHK